MIRNFFLQDKVWLGFIIGLLLPVIIYYGFEGLNIYSSKAVFNKPVIFSKSTSQIIALFFNVIVFRLYMLRWEKDYTGRGILMATFLYALTFFYLNRSYIL